jgi:hypothetical protein
MARPKVVGKREPRGKPFEKGYDPRRNLKGQIVANPMTAALRTLVSEGQELGIEDFEEIWRTGLSRAKAGDRGWAALIAAYSDGKPVARQEQGGPGDFGRPDLSGFSSEELREFIHAVRKGEEGA